MCHQRCHLRAVPGAPAAWKGKASRRPRSPISWNRFASMVRRAARSPVGERDRRSLAHEPTGRSVSASPKKSATAGAEAWLLRRARGSWTASTDHEELPCWLPRSCEPCQAGRSSALVRWSRVVETMGFEPTTPCLQTVRLVAVYVRMLRRCAPRSASSGLLRPARVARMWPERPHGGHALAAPDRAIGARFVPPARRCGHPARGNPPTAAVTYCDSRADDTARCVGPGGQRVAGVRR